MPRPALLLLLLTCVWPARAQEPESPPDVLLQTEDEFLKLPPNVPNGTPISVVYIKFAKLFEGQLKLYASQIPDGRLVVRDPTLLDRLNRVPPLDSDGQKLVPRRSNIQVVGTLTRRSGELVLEVNKIRLLESDEQWFTRRMEQITDKDPGKVIALAYEVSARAKLVEDDQERAGLSRLVGTLREKARLLERDQLPSLPGGAEAWIRYGRRYKDMDALVEVWATQAVPEPVRRQAEQALRQQNAHLLLGTWYAYDAFKAKLGLVQAQDGGETRWVTPERAAFLKAIEAERKKWRNGVPDFGLFENSVLEEEAARGNLIRGMRKHHVLAVRRPGNAAGESWLPVQVDRLRERFEQGTITGTITWEQWVMPDGTRVYFYNKIVISKEP